MRACLRLNQGLISETERLSYIQGDEMVGVSPSTPPSLLVAIELGAGPGTV